MPNKVGDGFRPILALGGGPEFTLIWASWVDIVPGSDRHSEIAIRWVDFCTRPLRGVKKIVKNQEKS